MNSETPLAEPGQAIQVEAKMQPQALVIGSTGAVGGAVASQLETKGFHVMRAARRDADFYVDIMDEASLKALAENAPAPLDLVFVATGALHMGDFRPEKHIRDLSSEALTWQFQVNTIGPALLAKTLIPKLNTEHRSIFAALSARVGSISDDRLGGWYGYRAAKAALNMTIKNLAIETKRNNPKAIIIGLHPGTVDSPLSKPFQANVPAGRLFSPSESAAHLIAVMEQVHTSHSGKIYDWAGVEIPP